MGDLMGLALAALLSLEAAEVSPPPRGPWLGSPAAAVVEEMRAHGFAPELDDRVLATQPSPAPYREILFYGEGPAVRIAARCLVKLRDADTVERIVRLAEADALGSARYPAALFGWVVGDFLRRPADAPHTPLAVQPGHPHADLRAPGRPHAHVPRLAHAGGGAGVRQSR